MNIQPAPVKQNVVSLYAAYLARRLRPSSVRQYLNVVRIIHVESGFPNPCEDNWLLKTTLAGIDKVKGNSVARKTPVTPELLLKIYSLLDLSKVFDCMFWAAALVMFFCILRKSNLFPNQKGSFDKDKQFVRSDFVCTESGVVMISIKWSKTNQCKSYTKCVKLFHCLNVLSPVTAIKGAFLLCKLPSSAPAFVSDSQGTPMTGSVFVKHFKYLVSMCGHDPSTYASHSFRRGAATWAMQCGVPSDIVKIMGDWKSNCYQSYIDQIPESTQDKYRRLLMLRLP